MKRATKSILTNSIALTLSPVIGFMFDSAIKKYFTTGWLWARALLTLLVTFLTAYLTYFVIYKITGYVPMGPAESTE